MAYEWINELPEEGELIESLLFEEILSLEESILEANCSSHCKNYCGTVRTHYSANNTTNRSYKSHNGYSGGGVAFSDCFGNQGYFNSIVSGY